MGEMIPYTQEMLSPWRTSRLGCYAINMMLLSGKLQGAENQLEYAAKALKDRPVLEKKGIVNFLKRELHHEEDRERRIELLRLHNQFIIYAF